MKQVILRLPRVKDRTGLSRSSIYLAISENKFPKSINLGTRCVGWVESEIDEWVDNKIEQTRCTANINHKVRSHKND